MRFLHTADWHAGKLLRGRSRIDEQRAVCEEIAAVAVQEHVHCLLLAGDLFDSFAPSPEAERLVYEFFAELVGRRIAAVVIGGNHDHPKRLQALRALLDPMRIHIRPEPQAPDSGGVLQLTHDGERAVIATLPFVTERKVVDALKLMGPEDEIYTAYSDRVARMCGRLCASFAADSINILLAHLHVDRAETSASERAVHVARPYAVDAERFPASAHYIALGHLHRPQAVNAPSPCRYAGSPLQLDFGEVGQQKQVVLVDAHAGRPSTIVPVPLSRGRRLSDVAGTLAELRALPPGEDFLRVTVRCQQPVPGIAEQVREVLPNAVDVRVEYARAASEAPRVCRDAPPEELFRQFYERRHQTAPADKLMALFRALHDEVVHGGE